MDPLEEFEIKPLTEGLGFHKRAVPLAEQVKSAGLAEANSVKVPAATLNEAQPLAGSTVNTRPQAFTDLLRALEKPVVPKSSAPAASATKPAAARDVQITEPLPRPGTAKKWATEVEIPRPVTPEFPTINSRPTPAATPLSKVVESVGLKRGAADSPMRMLERASVAFGAAILDGVVILALSLMFLVALMTLTKIDLAHLIFQVGLDVPTKVAFGVLFGSVLLMYVVVVRSFFGRTLGEWTFDHQMGDDQQHNQAVYPLLVLWRCTLMLATGLVVLPLLSAISGRDLAAPLTGLQLYRSR